MEHGFRRNDAARNHCIGANACARKNHRIDNERAAFDDATSAKNAVSAHGCARLDHRVNRMSRATVGADKGDRLQVGSRDR